MSDLTRSAPITGHDSATRTLTVQLLAWDDPRLVSDGGRPYTETWARDALLPLDRLAVWDDHHEPRSLIGHMDPPTDAGTGPVAELHIAQGHRAADDLLALVDNGTIRDVSIEFRPAPDGEVWNADRTEVTRTAAVLRGVAFTIQGAHDSPILQRGDPAMSDTETTQPIEVVTAPPAPEPDRPLVRADAVADELVALRGELVAMRDRPTLGGARHPAADFDTFGAYFAERALAREADTPKGLLTRALVDQITTNNPGVIPPGWINTVFGIVDRGRPLITAFGARQAPPSGMDFSWPYFDGNLSAIVAEQLTQKTEISSVRVDLKRGTDTLRSWAAGSDVSYQLQRRSEPSYMDALARIYLAAYSAETDAAAGADAVATATGAVDLAPLTATADQLRAALFNASVMVQAATGSPAAFAVASTNVFAYMGSLAGLWPSPYGTANVAGTADAGSLQVNVSGLPIIHDPYLAAGTLLVSNGEAGAWVEDGPFVVTSEDVAKLGHNYAIWGMGTWATFLPAGIVRIYDVP